MGRIFNTTLRVKRNDKYCSVLRGDKNHVKQRDLAPRTKHLSVSLEKIKRKHGKKQGTHGKTWT